MEFEEVKVVWNKVIPSIREPFISDDLVAYLTDYFSTSCCQQIYAQSKQNGSTAANDVFFEEAKRKPGSFPVILAALKKQNQPEILIEILKSVRKHIKTDRQPYVFRLIIDAAKALDTSVDEEIAALDRPNTISQPGITNQRNEPPSATGESTVHQQQLNQAASPRQPAVQTVAYVPNPQPSAVQSSGQIIYQRLQKSVPDIPLKDLKATSRNKISKAFMALQSNTHDLVWLVLLDNADLDISSQKASEIEKSRYPGKEFYDTLRDLGFTTRQLINVLQQQGCTDAANIVRQEAGNVASVSRDQAPVTPSYKEDLEKFDENNLDLARQRSQEEQLPRMNIQTADRSTQQNYLSNSPPSLEHSDTSDNNSYVSGESSIDSVTEGKRTQAMEAVGDRENEKTTLPPDGEREKLRNDRVSQHNDSQSNLDSFKDIKDASNQSKDMNVSNEPSSHVFSSTSVLDQPELYQQQGAGNSPGFQSNVQETGTQSCTTEKNQLEHIEGPVNYAAEVKSETMRKLHSEEDSFCLSLSPLQLDENGIQVTDQRSAAENPAIQTVENNKCFTNT